MRFVFRNLALWHSICCVLLRKNELAGYFFMYIFAEDEIMENIRLLYVR